MVPIVVETEPASKPPAAVGVRIYTVERHSFGASAPLLARASPTDFLGARDLAMIPTLVKLVGP